MVKRKRSKRCGNKLRGIIKLSTCACHSYNCQYICSDTQRIKLTSLRRLNLETSRREQRLMLEPRHRAMSLGGQWYTNNAIGASQSSPTSPLALPAPEDSHPLYKDWEIFSRWLKTEDERVGQDLQLVRPSSWGDTPAAVPAGDSGSSAVLYRLRCEVEDAIMFEENRAKRAAMERRSHLAPSDAMRQQVREMAPAPRVRKNTVETIASSKRSSLSELQEDLSESSGTIRPRANLPSPDVSPSTSPLGERHYFDPSRQVHSPTHSPVGSPVPHDVARSSVSTTRSSISFASDALPSPSIGLGIDGTTHTSPESAFSQTIRTMLATPSLVPIALPESALQLTILSHKVLVECTPAERTQGKEKKVSKICDVFWSYREDGGILLQSVYRSEKSGKVRTCIVQNFPALGPSIPLTTTIDGEISVDFPRGSCGKLDKQWTDVTYTFPDWEASIPFQTLLYTNNNKDAAKLLYDRPVRNLGSDKNKSECRGRNLRLWLRPETHIQLGEQVQVDVLILLFYTSCREDKGHWVEEPHYAFEWLTESVYAKKTEKLSLVFSSDPRRWTSDKLFKARKSSRDSTTSNGLASPIVDKRKDSMEIPGITRSGTGGSTASSAASIRTTRTFFSRSRSSSRIGNVNSGGYSKLEIEFQSSKDRKAFLDIWRQYVKPLGTTE